MAPHTTEKKRAIAFSIDSYIPGLYAWTPWLSLCIGGEAPDDRPFRYPGQIVARWGMAVILPGYLRFRSPQRQLKSENYVLEGTNNFSPPLLPARRFEEQMNALGYKETSIKKIKGQRIAILWTHPRHRRLEAIFSADRGTFLTAYHPN